MSLEDLENADFRRQILNLLNADTDASINDSILKSELAVLGYPIATDRLKQQLYWLQAQGLVAVESLISGILLITLTDKGEDVACNRSKIEGIARGRLK